jgi:hypothetical protein
MISRAKEYKFALAVCTRHKLCRGGGATKFVSCANVLVQIISGYETGYGHQVCVCTSVVCVIRTLPVGEKRIAFSV